MAPTPTANEITVREVLDKLGGTFAQVADAVGNGEFVLWVGSGISRQAPNLGDLIERGFDYIRERAIDPATRAAYMPALKEALELAEIDPATVQSNYPDPLAAWPSHKAIIDCLWNKYSRVLDIRIAGQTADFILWEAINIRQAFEHPVPPAAEHLCIAILILEGAVQAVASANWDNFIEAAVARLSNNVPGVLQVVVDPKQLRGPACRAKLLKFHGCIAHATLDPTAFRRFLTGGYTQIMASPETAEFAAMRNAIVGLATAQKSLVLGLSIQDNNLQSLFSRAAAVRPWPWPCTPAAVAHVFCEDKIQQGQRDVLRLVYGNAYDTDFKAVHDATLLRAWGEAVLIALVLKLLADKLFRLMEIDLTSLGKASMAVELGPMLTALRNDLSALAVPPAGEKNRTIFVNEAITIWSRTLSIFRSGSMPASPDAYETLTQSTPILIAADQNAQGMSLGRLGVALSLIQYGREQGLWALSPPNSNELIMGAISARSSRPTALDRPIFIVKSATDAIALKQQGAFAGGNAVVVHADNVWHEMGCGTSARRVRAAPGRTGRVGEIHVSLGHLLARCVDTAMLQQEFVAEMML